MESNSPELESEQLALKNLAPISPEEQEKRGWKFNLNGTPDHVNWFTLSNPQLGVQVEYGRTSAGYDSFSVEEEGGGGVVNFPFVDIDGEVYVGLVLEDRPNAGGKVLNAVRGFLDPGENHLEAVSREFAEEVGRETKTDRYVLMKGENMNPNSTFFVTKGSDKGLKLYKMHVASHEVKEKVKNKDPKERMFEFNPSLVKAQSKAGEKIMNCTFMHWSKATQIQDGPTLTGMARLIPEEIIPRIEKKKEGGRLISVLKKIRGKKSA